MRSRGTGRSTFAALVVVSLLLAACSGGEEGGGDDGAGGAPTGETASAELRAGAASRSILPTVDGGQAYLDDAPGWPSAEDLDPDDIGTFVAAWDQGVVDVGNGSGDSAWVHDDLTATAVALERGDDRVVLVSTDTYMHFAPDADEVARRARSAVDGAWADAPVLVAATHNHHGPDTAFSVNDDWYARLADQVAEAVVAAVDSLVPATITVGAGEHGYGVNDTRDPVILDRRLNVMALDAAADGAPIATVVQWANHPETTLGWDPPLDAEARAEACAAKGWAADDCSAEGRYLTADYPGVLRTRIQEERGGEVLYVNGALGNQVGPGQAQAWIVDEDHPVTADGMAPPGAEPLTPCDDADPLLCQSLAKTESIGSELARASLRLLADGREVVPSELTVDTERFFTRMTNIGFRVLLADGSLGWRDAELFTCDGEPSAETCSPAGMATEEDPVITPLADSEVVVGDVVASRITRLDLGEVGFMFLPGELPPELVVGLPANFAEDTAAYFRTPDQHAAGDAYEIPGHLLSLVDEEITFTVGLGTDELGYWVPLADYRLRCIDLALPDGATCGDLAARGVIPAPDHVDGTTCAALTADPAALAALGADAAAVAAACRYGQALGRELGEPEGHYEETNAVGWDVVEDLWAAAEILYGRQ